MMKQLVIFLGSSIFILGLMGCQGLSQADLPKSDVDVIVEGGEEFPETLAGTWKANEQGWEIVFEPNGVISSAVHTLGRIRMKPNQVTKMPMKGQGEGVFECGVWTVYYKPDNRELTVEIVVENFRAELGSGLLEGSSLDVFIGPVSEDGNTWWAE